MLREAVSPIACLLGDGVYLCKCVGRMQETIFPKLGSVLQLAVLQQVKEETAPPLMVANTHLFFHPNASVRKCTRHFYLLSPSLSQIARSDLPLAFCLLGLSLFCLSPASFCLSI